jgi:hypothetical protein
MNRVLEYILIGAGIMLACGLASLAYEAYKETSKIAYEATKDQNDFASELSEYDVTLYEGKEVSGSDVVNYIYRQLGEYITTETAPFYINVVTTLSENIYTNNRTISDINNFTTMMYIKPDAIFGCSVNRDENNVIKGVKFTQK